MKKTRLTEGLRNILKKKAAFLTLCLIITLGLGGFCAAQFAQSSMKAAGKAFFERGAFKDYDMFCSVGIDRAGLERIQAVESVAAAEGRFETDAVYSYGATDRAVRALSLTQEVSIPQLCEGRLPARADECLVDPDLLGDSGAKLGDSISLRSKAASGGLSGSYTVVGTAYHPDYLRRDTVYTVVLTQEAFDPSGKLPFSSVSVRAARDGDADVFSEAGFRQTAATKAALEKLSDALREDTRRRLEEACPGVEIPEEMLGNWIVLDRRSNAGYTEYSSTIGAVNGAGSCFGLLFLLVMAMECFSTVSLLVEEQKKLVGTQKAFGFRRHEVLSRYLLFGVGAALIGTVLGISLACGLGRLLLWLLEQTELYVFPARKLVLLPWVMLAAGLGAALLCALSASLACRALLRSSANDLMRGALGTGCRKTARHSSRSVYSQLILRNLLREKARVALTVIVTAASCILIGASITVKLAYDGMNIRQLRDVWLYDLRVDLGPDTEAAEREKLEQEMDALGVSCISAGYGSCLFENSDRLDAAIVICADADALGRIVGLEDPVSGEIHVPDDDGILIQYRMGENLTLGTGDSLTVLDAGFRRRECRINGFVQNYQKRIILFTPACYRNLFDADFPQNSYFLRLNGTSDQALREALLAISDDLGFERADSFFDQYRAIAFMYNAVVLAVTVIAILISFVILINLASIFVSRKKRELIVMRINGFSLRRTRGFLTGEAFVTTAAGLVLGTLAGIPIGGIGIRFMETPDVMFVREAQPAAWAAAVLLEGFFAMLIYGTAIRHVKNYQLSDLNDAG